MKRLPYLLVPAFLFLLTGHSCTNSKDTTNDSSKVQVKSGTWRFVMDLDDKLLPFTAELDLYQDKPKFSVTNANESITLTDLRMAKDSIVAFFPAFQSELALRIDGPNLLSGKWYNHNRKDYSIPITGEFDKNFRFTSSKSRTSLPKRYKVVFAPQSDDTWNAILELENSEGKLEGTFLTETGDYRFLDGNIMNDKVYLSTFDGSHAFYFEADISGDSLLNGDFYSGTHYKTDWFGGANQAYQLTAPEKLTYLKEGEKYFDFKLPNQDGDTVSWKDLDLKGKVVLVDIMGSWCPNCLDANKAIHDLISNYDSEDVEVITIAFEKTPHLDEARNRVFNMQKAVGVEPGFLFGGSANKTSASEAFPMLNHIMSFPTLIFIDKNREIRQIYTGFYGPGTGEHYKAFMSSTDSLLYSMVNGPI